MKTAYEESMEVAYNTMKCLGHILISERDKENFSDFLQGKGVRFTFKRPYENSAWWKFQEEETQ